MTKLLIINSWTPPHSDNFFYKIKKTLSCIYDVQSVDIKFISPQTELKKWVISWFKFSIEDNYLTIPWIPKLSFVRYFVMIVKGFVFKNNYDVVHCNSSIFGLYFAIGMKIRNKNCKILVHEHRGRFINLNKSTKNEIDEVKHLKIFLNIINGITWCAVSKTLKKALKHKLNLKNVKYLPNIISKVDFKEGKKTDTSNLIKFIYVGGINKQKNVFYTLKVFSELSKIVSKKLHLTMIGDGPELHNLRKKYCLETNDIKNIEFTGPLSNSSVLKMINESNIMIHLSTFEGFGMVVKEAHMCGVPVIALENSGGAAELIEKKYGIVISGNNYKEDSNFIKHKLNFLLNIDANLLKKSCQDFSEHKFLERYKSILKC